MSAGPVLRGIVASRGFAVGQVQLLTREAHAAPRRTLREDEVDGEVTRFDAALDAAEHQVDELLARMREADEDGRLIVEAHRLMLRDEMLVGRARGLIRADRCNAEHALERTVASLDASFERLREAYFRERGGELRYVADWILANLLGSHPAPSVHLAAGAVVVAHDLSPADTLDLASRRLAGFITEVGGATCHTAIMARAMEIPAIVGCHGVVDAVVNGQLVALDGAEGLVLIAPSEADVDRIVRLEGRHRARVARLLANRDQPAVTSDGRRLGIHGNIEYVEEIESLIGHGGEAIGLFRTEYLFLGRSGLPDEETQYRAYRRAVEEMAPSPVTFRTIDVGGDKLSAEGGTTGAPGLGRRPREDNPGLGVRGIRFALAEEGLLRTQLRALLRASGHGTCRLLIPFVTCVEEVRAVRALVDETQQELLRSGIAVAAEVPLGCMIELPGAALIADALARECDFFSIGTNDLIQYTLAADRNNEAVAGYYTPFHPAVLRLIAETARAARAAGIECALCGEMAGEPLPVPALIGCGLDVLSMNPISVPVIKALVRQVSAAECEALTAELLGLASAVEVEARLQAFYDERLAVGED
jgi:phosphotransferase system enzyme I (PtsI)